MDFSSVASIYISGAMAVRPLQKLDGACTFQVRHFYFERTVVFVGGVSAADRGVEVGYAACGDDLKFSDLDWYGCTTVLHNLALVHC